MCGVLTLHCDILDDGQGIIHCPSTILRLYVLQFFMCRDFLIYNLHYKNHISLIFTAAI